MPTRLSRYCEGVMEAAWLAAALLVPVFFNIYSSRIFEPDKIAILRSLALIVLAAWIVKLVETGRWRWEHAQPGEGVVRSILRLPLIIPVTAFAAIYLISTMFSVTQRVSLWGSYQRLQGTYTTFSYLAIFAALLGNLRRREQVERLITTIIISSLPVSLYGFLQRYKIDPIPWGGDVSRRIASNMGNSIFVAAYLIMVFPLTLGRIIDSFRSIWQGSAEQGAGQPGIEKQNAWQSQNGSLTAQVARGTVYVFTAAVQLIAIYMSGSRGPTLGLLAGGVVFLVLFTWHWKLRWLTNAILGLSVLGVFSLAVFNIPNGPLEELRRSPVIGRFGLLLDAESNSALVRRYIWEGTVKLVSFHDPLRYPDGSKDAFNSLRPLIGYGPESMYVAFNPFYIPALGQVEKRNASPDRAHNETWDAMVNTGVLGLAIYLCIFLLIFYYSLTWIGLIPGTFQRNLFLLLTAAGGGVGAILMVVWRGVEYIGLGLPVGLVVGLVLYVLYSVYAVPFPSNRSEGEIARSLTLIVLLVAILSHFLEINFGIAIVVTRTYFWMYSALLILVGYLLPKYGEYFAVTTNLGSEREAEGGLQGITVPNATRVEPRMPRARKARRAERRSERGARVADRRQPSWLQAALPEAGLASLLMVTLGYDYISNTGRSTSAFQILWASLAHLPNQGNALSFGILALVFTTWLMVVALLAAEKTKCETRQSWLRTGLPILAISGAVSLLYWLWQAGTLAVLVQIVPQTIGQLKMQVGRVGSMLTNYYFYFLLIVIGLAFYLPADWPARRSESSITSKLFGLILAIASFWIIYFTNIRVIHADIAFKMAEPSNRPGQWQVATELYLYTNSLAPDQDHYYLFLGRSYLEQAKAETNPSTQDQLVKDAEQELKVAQRKNPLNTDHTANLGRLYSWWASKATDPQQRRDRGEIASNYYATALTLSPQNSTLWGEWALLYLDVLNSPEEAYKRLEHALQLDTSYNWTQGLMGDYYVHIARSFTDTVTRQDNLELALGYYNKALQISSSAEVQAKIGYLASIGNIYVDLKQYDDAVTAYIQALQVGPSSTDKWRIEETIARTYLMNGDQDNALQYANTALKDAPEDQAGRLNQFIAEIKGK